MSKVAIVTGGGSGIGRESAIALGGAGYSVVVAGRRLDALEETAKLVEDQGAEVLAVVCDVGNEGDVEALFAATVEHFGRLDVLFNNAGNFGSRDPLEYIPLSSWLQTVQTNVTGTFLCTREAFRVMKDQDPRGGRIINNGSISAHTPRENSVAYTATKHAVLGLTKASNLDGRKYDIAVGQIDIGNAAAGTLASAGEDRMDVANVGEAIVYMAGLPLNANVLYMTVMATKMPFVGRG